MSYVRQYLRKEYHYSDDYLNKAGLKIYTTLDTKLQGYAEKSMRDRLNELGGRKLQGAMVCIDPWTGRVLAMYGGRDYYDKTLNGEFNRATLAKRQPGSTFKPYVYAAAMEAGLTPDTVEDRCQVHWCSLATRRFATTTRRYRRQNDVATSDWHVE